MARRLVVIFLVVAIVGILLTVYVSIDKKSENEKIYDVLIEQKNFKFSSATDFMWDIAYVDYQYYLGGKVLFEKYGLTDEFEALQSDNTYRIAFYSGTELVRSLVASKEYFIIDPSVEVIYPDMVFDVELMKNGRCYLKAN